MTVLSAIAMNNSFEVPAQLWTNGGVAVVLQMGQVISDSINGGVIAWNLFSGKIYQ